MNGIALQAWHTSFLEVLRMIQGGKKGFSTMPIFPDPGSGISMAALSGFKDLHTTF
jgi:hypothetical protein